MHDRRKSKTRARAERFACQTDVRSIARDFTVGLFSTLEKALNTVAQKILMHT